LKLPKTCIGKACRLPQRSAAEHGPRYTTSEFIHFAKSANRCRDNKIGEIREGAITLRISARGERRAVPIVTTLSDRSLICPSEPANVAEFAGVIYRAALRRNKISYRSYICIAASLRFGKPRSKFSKDERIRSPFQFESRRTV